MSGFGPARDGVVLRWHRVQPAHRHGRQGGRHRPAGLDPQLPALQLVLLKPYHFISGNLY